MAAPKYNTLGELDRAMMAPPRVAIESPPTDTVISESDGR